MNVKYDDNRKFQQNRPYAPQAPAYGQPNNSYQNYPTRTYPQQNYSQNNQNNYSSFPTEKIVGEKPCNILVRELWLGGIPENYDKSYMSQVMSYYGII